MPPLALPNQGPLPLPAPPSEPPTDDDYFNAFDYRRLIEQGKLSRDARVTSTHLVEARLYEEKVLVARSADVAPPWLAGALQPLFDTNARIEARLGRMEARLDRMEARLGPIQRVGAKAHNVQCGKGDFIQLEEMPFHDNSLPTKAPHNLPLLSSVAVIDTLSQAHARSYFEGYYPNVDVPRGIDARRLAIKKAIGQL
ncbi:hypothetical protein SCP_0301220 [Sparassis crispa]|uniref:Mug135-like C-terminal domain-containing protein n=1 Tax=Sparassis crispa TaxID=139825 RepID=A0A401GE18_9APHY|nr:hypothetical protein SCP_0301220 [Sparassis crispa]GBE80407.1 hypothetical protein SCP_0301220 [Sparassis crispa]